MAPPLQVWLTIAGFALFLPVAVLILSSQIGLLYPKARRLRSVILEHLALAARHALPLGPALIALARERDDGKSRWWRMRIGDPEPHGKEAQLIREMAARLESEGSLARTLAATPRMFPEAWVELVRQAEGKGAVPETLAQLSQEEEDGFRVHGRLAEMFAYPLVAGVLVAGLALFLNMIVFPKMLSIDREFLGNFALASPELRYGVASSSAILLCFLLGGGLTAWACAQQGGLPARLLTRAARRLGSIAPLVGEHVRQHIHARWLQRVGALMQAGGTWTESLAGVAQVAEGSVRAALQEAGQLAREGQPLPVVLERALGRDAPRLLPPLVLALDRAGNLADGLRSHGARLDRRAGRRLNTAGDLLKVVPLLLIAAVVAGQAFAMWSFVLGTHAEILGVM